MAIPIEQLVIVGPDGKRIDVEKMTEELRRDEKRVLADDEVGLVV